TDPAADYGLRQFGHGQARVRAFARAPKFRSPAVDLLRRAAGRLPTGRSSYVLLDAAEAAARPELPPSGAGESFGDSMHGVSQDTAALDTLVREQRRGVDIRLADGQ